MEPRNRFPQAYVAWRAGTTNRVVVPGHRLGIDSWATYNVSKYGLRTVCTKFPVLHQSQPRWDNVQTVLICLAWRSDFVSHVLRCYYYTVKKGYRFARPHPGWGRENGQPFFTVFMTLVVLSLLALPWRVAMTLRVSSMSLSMERLVATMCLAVPTEVRRIKLHICLSIKKSWILVPCVYRWNWHLSLYLSATHSRPRSFPLT